MDGGRESAAVASFEFAASADSRGEYACGTGGETAEFDGCEACSETGGQAGASDGGEKAGHARSENRQRQAELRDRNEYRAEPAEG